MRAPVIYLFYRFLTFNFVVTHAPSNDAMEGCARKPPINSSANIMGPFLIIRVISTEITFDIFECWVYVSCSAVEQRCFCVYSMFHVARALSCPPPLSLSVSLSVSLSLSLYFSLFLSLFLALFLSLSFNFSLSLSLFFSLSLLRFTVPYILPVATPFNYTFTHSHIHTFHTFTHSHIHTFTHSHIHTFTHHSRTHIHTH